MKPEDRWQEIAPKFRTPSKKDKAPYGFSTRVVAAANLGLPKQSRALLLWRRYSLSMAGAAAILLGINLLNQPPIDQQFLPLPDADFSIPHSIES